MTDYTEGIIEEIKHYLKDSTYPYAILLDGSWGIGKTHFVKNELLKALSGDDASTNSLTVKYISLYGCSSKDDIKTTILETILSDHIDTIINDIQDGKTYDQKKSRRANYLKKGISFIGRSASFFLARNGIDLDKTKVLNEIINLSKYFLIIDDLERCTCPITETLGILNELVEHDAVKMLLVANENEIMNIVDTRNDYEALEYLVAANKDIIVEIPKSKNQLLSTSTPIKEPPFDADHLRQRASSIFSSKPQRKYYDIIKEKLIGHTIRFQPDVSTTMHQIIQDTLGNTSALKDILNNQVAKYCAYFEQYKHPNFRTFQFFISKAVFLYNHCSKMKFQEQHKRSLMEEMVLQCFVSSLAFKSRMHKLESSLDDMAYPLKIEISFIPDYVEYGIYNKQTAKNDLQHYVDSHFATIIPDDDPLIQLRDSYYLNDEKWVSEKYAEVMKSLEENQYPTSFYSLILRIACDLTKIGFEDVSYSGVEKQMRALIAEHNNTDYISSSAGYLSNTEEYKRINNTIDKLNEMILKNVSKGRTKSLEAVLESKDWIKELEKYVVGDPKVRTATSIFSRIATQKWVNRIMESSPAEIYNLRLIVKTVYPSNFVSIQLKNDSYSIASIAEELKKLLAEERVEDKIMRQNIGWLIKDLSGLCTMIDEYEQALQE